MTSNAKTSRLSTGLAALVLSVGLAGPAAAAEPVLPNWAAIFGADGSLLDEVDASGSPGANGVPDYQDLYDGVDAVFISDNLSDDLAVDMSVRSGAEALSEDMVYNGTVSAPQDLGNAHVLATLDLAGNLQLSVGVELLSYSGEEPQPDTYVEIEFNQDTVRVRSGDPWPIHGSRTAGDLLVRMSFAQGALGSVDFKRWDAALGFQLITTATISASDPGPCYGGATPYVICTGTPPLDPPPGGVETWDFDGNPVASVAPDKFVEVSLDVGALLGANLAYKSTLIRTARDIAFGSLSMTGDGS